MPRSLDDWRRSEATALPGWIKPQLSRLVDQAPDGPEWLHEIKFDGYRISISDRLRLFLSNSLTHLSHHEQHVAHRPAVER
jgi:hypothetical protein